MLRCEELLKKRTIDSYYEFLFTMALAAECGRRGTSLDMSSIKVVDKGMLSKDDLDYMHYLRSIGSIYDGSSNNDDLPLESPKYFFDVNAITDLYSKLFKEDEDCYYWDTSYAFDTYGKYIDDIMKKKTVGNTIMHLMAHMLICFKLKERQEKVVKFFFKNFEVVTIHLYINLLACSKSIEALKDLCCVELDDNYIENIGDIDFNILYDTAMHAGRLKKWSCKDKFTAFKNYGFEKGSIAVLYERGRTSDSNPVGKILRSSIIRIDDYVEDLKRGAGWKVTKFCVNKTIEESEDDYYGIDEEYRGIFSDLLKPSIGSTSSFLSFDGVGVGTYFLDEENIIMPIEREERVSKKVSVDGKNVILELDDVEVVYWILKQYGVDFDDVLYKKYYNDGKPLMWDKYDCTPVLRKRVFDREVDFERDYADCDD